MNNKIFSEDVTIISVVPLDFVTKEGDKICGYTIHYYRELREDEKERNIGKRYEKIYLNKDKLDDLDKYKNKTYPYKTKIDFEFVSLDKKPKPIRVIL